MISGVYEIRNNLTGDFYIGSSLDVLRRWNQHAWHLDLGIHHASTLQEDWNRYGCSAFSFRVLEQTTVSDRRLVERHLIATLHPAYNKKSKKPRPVSAAVIWQLGELTKRGIVVTNVTTGAKVLVHGPAQWADLRKV